MSVVDEGDARRTAEAALATWGRPVEGPDSVVVWKVEEHSRAWIVHVATRQWLETRDVRHVLVGASPLVVEKSTGTLHAYGSSPDEHARFTAWLDTP